MNAELASLLQAAKETPDDDTPRLVIADWLDEHGEPARADLLRVQCHPDRRTETVGMGLRARADELIAANGERWWGQDDERVHVVSIRGLLIVYCDLASLRDSRFTPTLRDTWQQGWVNTVSVDLQRSPSDPWSILAECPWLVGVADLAVQGRTLNDDAALILARSPHLGSLYALLADHCDLTPAAEQALLDSVNLSRLCLLSGEDNHRLALAGLEAKTTGVLHLTGVDISRPAILLTLARARGPIPEVRADQANLSLEALQRVLARTVTFPEMRRIVLSDVGLILSAGVSGIFGERGALRLFTLRFFCHANSVSQRGRTGGAHAPPLA